MTSYLLKTDGSVQIFQGKKLPNLDRLNRALDGKINFDPKLDSYMHPCYLVLNGQEAEYMFFMSAANDLSDRFEKSTLKVNSRFAKINPESRILGDVWVGKIDPENDDILPFPRAEFEKLMSSLVVSPTDPEGPWQIGLQKNDESSSNDWYEDDE